MKLKDIDGLGAVKTTITSCGCCGGRAVVSGRGEVRIACHCRNAERCVKCVRCSSHCRC